MIEINLFDREFSHTEKIVGYLTSTYYTKPKKIKWIKSEMSHDGITIFTDSYVLDPIVDQVNSKIKIFWLMEPPAINNSTYENIVKIEDKFDYILTYDENLLKRSDKYIKYIVGQTRIDIPNIYPKSKFISMIASNKRMSVGHRYRHEIASFLHNKYDVHMWGSGYKGFNDKMQPLADYYFTISVMNCKMNNYFTEVLVDNFMCGTVPIFWGCPNIDEYFDINGIITFDTIEELDYILKNLTIDDYHNRMESIKNNLITAEKYNLTDDYIADILKQKFKL